VATERPGTPEETQVVMVEEGDTLWCIASQVATDGEVREMVDRIERLNALEGSGIQVGQQLRVPTGG
jgi:LysM repeat protein